MRSNAIEIKNCLQNAITAMGISISKAEVLCGLSHSTLSKSGDMRLSVLMTVLKNFPQISIEWLIKGEGEMFDGEGMDKQRESAPKSHANAPQSHETPHEGEYYLTDIHAATEKINALNEKINLMERIITGKDEVIEILKSTQVWQRREGNVR